MNEFWKNKKVLITGNTGFKGSWLSLLLLKLGATVKGYSLKCNYKPNIYKLYHLEKKFETVNGNILNLNKFKETLISFKPDIIFHLAAQPLVKKSYNNPYLTFKTNILGTINVYECLKKIENNIKVVINVTSDKVYRNEEKKIRFKEEDYLGGFDPYSCSKSCADLIEQSYRKSFLIENNINSSTVRAGNVIGGGDWSKDRLIPDLIRSVRNDKDLIIRYPHAIRPWQHVLDPTYGYIKLAEKMYYNRNYSSEWNFGPEANQVCSVEDLINRFLILFKKKKIVKKKRAIHSEAISLQLDIHKVKKKLRWKPKWNLKKTIIETANWYKEYLDGGDIQKITDEQIKNFLKN